MRSSPWLCLCLVAALGGCEAKFHDLRPGGGSAGGAASTGGGTSTAGGGGSSTAGGGDGTTAGGMADPDAGTATTCENDTGADQILATGEFEGAPGYNASGRVDLVCTAAQQLQAQFAENFRGGGVPGPFIVVTTRPRITDGIDELLGDIPIGPAQATNGAQTYDLPAEALDSTHIHSYYCRPFSVEVGFAEWVFQ